MSPVQERSWWSRHWKWVVPVGCLTPTLVCAGFVTLIMSAVFDVMKSSPPYTKSLAIVRASSEAQTLLGTPIEPGFFVSGDMETGNVSGHAEIGYEVSGPIASGTVHFVADQVGGRWTFTRLDLTMEETGKRVELLFPE